MSHKGRTGEIDAIHDYIPKEGVGADPAISDKIGRKFISFVDEKFDSKKHMHCVN